MYKLSFLNSMVHRVFSLWHRQSLSRFLSFIKAPSERSVSKDPVDEIDIQTELEYNFQVQWDGQARVIWMFVD